MKQVLNFINGEYTSTEKTFEKRSPLNGKVIAQVHEAGKREVDAAVAAARAALNGPWGKMSVAERVERLYAVADNMNTNGLLFLWWLDRHNPADRQLAAMAIHLIDEQGCTQQRHVPRVGGGSAARSGLVTHFVGAACVVRADTFAAVNGQPQWCVFLDRKRTPHQTLGVARGQLVCRSERHGSGRGIQSP